MTAVTCPTCTVIRPAAIYAGKQGFDDFAGISAESAGASAICMHLLMIPPGARAKAHLHQAHETAIYLLSGAADTWFGERLAEHPVVQAGEFFYIPAGMPHLPVNCGPDPCLCIIARADSNEQEGVVLLPELDELVPASTLNE